MSSTTARPWRSSQYICSKHFEQETKERRRDLNSSCKIAVCCEGDDVCNYKEKCGRGKSQEAITKLVLKAILRWHEVFAVYNVWFKDSDSSKTTSPFPTRNVKAFEFILEARSFSRGCRPWHRYLNFQTALTKSPEDVIGVKQSCNSLSEGIQMQEMEDLFKRAFWFGF